MPPSASASLRGTYPRYRSFSTSFASLYSCPDARQSRIALLCIAIHTRNSSKFLILNLMRPNESSVLCRTSRHMPSSHARHVRAHRKSDLARSQSADRLCTETNNAGYCVVTNRSYAVDQSHGEVQLFQLVPEAKRHCKDVIGRNSMSLGHGSVPQKPRRFQRIGSNAPPRGSTLTTVSTTKKDPAPNELASSHDPQPRCVLQTISR